MKPVIPDYDWSIFGVRVIAVVLAQVFIDDTNKQAMDWNIANPRFCLRLADVKAADTLNHNNLILT